MEEYLDVRCLFLSPFLPYPPYTGGRMRMYELLKGLAANHRVDILTLAEASPEDRSAVAELRDQGFEVEVVIHQPRRIAVAMRALARRRSLYSTLHYSVVFADALAYRLRSGAYDVVQCEFFYMGQYRYSNWGPPWVLDEHNVEFYLSATLAEKDTGMVNIPYRVYSSRERTRRRKEELSVCRRVDHVLTVSDYDRVLLQRELPGLPVAVVPNGVDIRWFTPSLDPPTNERIGAVFIGAMDYRPNVDAVKWFCKEILPLVRRVVPSFTFTIVGANPTASVLSLSHVPGVHVTGRVVDTRPYLAKAAVAVVPLRAGSGTRLKILEALAMGRAVVSTSIGCQGLETLDGEHLLQADDPALFADRVVKLLTEPSERARLGQQGRCLVEKLYTWKQAVGTIETVYEALARKSKQEHAGVVR